jgi:hypothetical protein
MKFQHLTANLICDVIAWSWRAQTEDLARDFAEKPWPLEERQPLRIICGADIKVRPRTYVSPPCSEIGLRSVWSVKSVIPPPLF